MGLKTSNPTFPLLKEELPDIEEHIGKDIKVIRVQKNIKKPLGTNWTKREVKLNTLKKHNGNFGILPGFKHQENGYSIGVLDIDGYGKGEVKTETQKAIFEVLAEKLGNETILVKTQSGGFHIYFYSSDLIENFHKLSNSLHFPKDFHIKELGGKSLSHSIEIFNKTDSKQVLLPGSVVNGNKYEVIGENRNFNDLPVIANMEERIIEALTGKGYFVVEEQVKTREQNKKPFFKQTTYTGDERKNKTLTDEEYKEFEKLIIPCYQQTEKNSSKHYFTFALSGVLNKYLADESISRISKIILKHNGTGFNIADEELFIKTLWANVENRSIKKVGFPTVKRILKEAGFSELKASNIIEKFYNIVGDKYENLKEGRGNNRGLTVPSLSPDDKGILIERLNTDLNSFEYWGECKAELLQNVIFTFACKGRIALEDIEAILIQAIARIEEVTEEVEANIKTMIYEKWKNTGLEKLEAEKEQNKEHIEKVLDAISTISNNIYKICEKTAPTRLSIIRETCINKGLPTRKTAEYLNEHLGVAINDIDGLPIIYNPKFNRYDTITLKKLYKLFVKEILQLDNLTTQDHIKLAFEHITEWKKPNYEVIGFSNCNYSFKTHKVIDKFHTPTFPYFNFNFEYNPQAQVTGEHNIKNFLYTSLKGVNEEETERNVKGILQLIGYYLKPGNERQIVVNCVGVGGSGKGTLEKIITNLFGADRVSNVGVHQYEEDFGRSSLIGKYLNIDSDASSKSLGNCSFFKKSISDNLYINIKNKEPMVLNAEAVPKTMIMSNQAIRFHNENNLYGKFILVEFLNTFRNTDKAVLNYDKIITGSPEDMEWLIYQSLHAFKEMEENGEDFIYRLSSNDNANKMAKYQDPLTFILGGIVEPTEAGELLDYHIVYINELETAIKSIAENEKLEIETTPTGKVKKLKKALAKFLDVPERETVSKIDGNKRYYPNIKWKEDPTKWVMQNLKNV